MEHIPNLKKSRHGVFYWRTKTNGKETAISLRTKDPTTAKIIAFKIHLDKAMNFKKFEIDLHKGIFKSDGTVSDSDNLVEAIKLLSGRNTARSLPSLDEVEAMVDLPQKMPQEASKRFSEVVFLYLEERKLSNREKTLQEKESKFKEFELLFNDPHIKTITDETAITYKQRLISNGLTPARINKSISFFNDLFNYSIQNKYYNRTNPFEKMAISKKGKKRQVKSYQAFTEEELKQIYNSKENYIWYSSAHQKIKSDFYWLPFLALFTGARIGELAALQVTDIKKENDIFFFDITEQDDQGIKSDNSVRKVPIHKQLIELGFITYVEALKNQQGMIFPHLITAKSGYAKNTSRRFNEDYLTGKLKITNQQKKFHSFRSTFINRLTYLNVHPAILQSIVGHYEQTKVDFSSAHFSVYQQQKPITVLKEVIDHLQYPEIDFSSYLVKV